MKGRGGSGVNVHNSVWFLDSVEWIESGHDQFTHKTAGASSHFKPSSMASCYILMNHFFLNIGHPSKNDSIDGFSSNDRNKCYVALTFVRPPQRKTKINIKYIVITKQNRKTQIGNELWARLVCLMKRSYLSYSFLFLLQFITFFIKFGSKVQYMLYIYFM